MAPTMHHLPEAPLHKSIIFLGDWTMVIGADFHIGPNNWLLTLTFTLTLTCGAGQPGRKYRSEKHKVKVVNVNLISTSSSRQVLPSLPNIPKSHLSKEGYCYAAILYMVFLIKNSPRKGNLYCAGLPTAS